MNYYHRNHLLNSQMGIIFYFYLLKDIFDTEHPLRWYCWWSKVPTESQGIFEAHEVYVDLPLIHKVLICITFDLKNHTLQSIDDELNDSHLI